MHRTRDRRNAQDVDFFPNSDGTLVLAVDHRHALGNPASPSAPSRNRSAASAGRSQDQSHEHQPNHTVSA
jgi:hypothetical protein